MRERLLQGIDRASVTGSSDQALARMLYRYHYRGGYKNIASLSCQKVVASVTVGVCFFICTCVLDWRGVVSCAPDACTVVRLHLPGPIGCLFLIMYASAGVSFSVIALQNHRLLRRVRDFYMHTLGLPDDVLHVTEWTSVLDVILKLEPRLRPTAALDAVQMTQLVMRDTNYLTMLVNSEQLTLSTVSRPTLALLWCFFWRPLYAHGRMQTALLGDTEFLRSQQRRAVLAGVLLSPFTFAWMTLSCVLGNVRVRNMRDTEMAKRVFSTRARFQLRHFNELPHIFDERLARATELANKYLDAFPNPYASVAETAFMYSVGMCMTIIAAVGVVNEDAMTTVHVGSYNLFWWLALLTAWHSVAKRAPADPVVLSIRESRELLRLLSTYTMGSHDAKELHKLRAMLQPAWVHLLFELAEAFACPLRIWSIDVVSAAKLVRDNTLFGTPVGDVCSLAHAQSVEIEDDGLCEKMRQSWHALAGSLPSVSIEDIEHIESEVPVHAAESESHGPSFVATD